MEIEVTEPGEHAATSSARHRVGRRAFLGAGAGGAALSLLPFLSGRAAASATTDESTTTAATTPPQRPTADDVVTFIRDAHRAYAQSLSGMLGRSAPNNMSQELFDGLRSDFVGDVAGVLAAAQAFESSAVATHGDVIAKLQGTDGAALLASIQIAEARFCTALADLAGDTDPVTLLVDEEAESLVGRG